jgi:hypothetical protein
MSYAVATTGMSAALMLVQSGVNTPASTGGWVRRTRALKMRPTLIVLLTVVWLYAQVSGYTLGGRADVLPVLAIVIGLFGGGHRSPSADSRPEAQGLQEVGALRSGRAQAK